MLPTAAVRRFNRFYTRQIGALDESLLETKFSLSEARVLYEIAQRDRPTAAQLAGELGLDRGYLSRLLRAFQKRRLIAREASPDDGREALLTLTAKGRRAFAALDERQEGAIDALLRALPETAQARLVQAMATIEETLRGDQGAPATPYLLREPEPGDLGWVVHRHGALYAQEFGYDARFEALVARIVADFIEKRDPARERVWLAEKDGAVVGSVFLVKKTAQVAQLRLLFVEPRARGLGIGERLVAECIRFARSAGYRKIALWTQSHLAAARHIYQRSGFQLTDAEPHDRYGKELVAETWELVL